ncbi:cupin domain-containing protein [Spirulina major]|uniref:cupin domain-containing protein n=1 Tax=Spirulina major TaxID=270636 RepID=UPI000933B56B|nr:cupin domain-containing protein [Spirulina major]
MQLNADLRQRACLDTHSLPWIDSPAPGVQRRMLDRDGGEIARATSLVKFAPHRSFPAHTHGGGEEFFVLDGVFSDEFGDFGPGSYLRNPVGSRHRPHTNPGTTIFVKLCQMHPDDQTPVRIDTHKAQWQPGLVPGLSVLPLHQYGTEQVALVRWEPGTQFNAHTHWGGEEIFVIEGVFADELGDYPAGTWLRNPAGSRHCPYSTTGCTIYVKVGHLPG